MTEGVLLILQNIDQSNGIEFAERMIEMQDQSLLIGGGAAQPATLNKGTNGQVLKIVSNQIAWADEEAIENLTGTSSSTWAIDDQATNHVILNVSVDTLRIYKEDNTSLADVEAGDGTFNVVNLNTDPTSDDHATRKSWVVSHVSSEISSAVGNLSGAMIMKGNVISNAQLPTTYEVGWTYRVNLAGTYVGNACEIGDLLTAIVARSGSGNTNSDWTIGQTNVVDAVTCSLGSATATGRLPIFSSTTGKTLGDSGVLYSDLLLQTDLVANSIIIGDGTNSHDILILPTNSFVGRNTTAGVQDLSASEARTVLNVEDGANNYTHPSLTALTVSLSALEVVSSFTSNSEGHVTSIAKKTLSPANLAIYSGAKPASNTTAGSKGQMFIDDDYLYICTLTGTEGSAMWKRVMLAKTWAS